MPRPRGLAGAPGAFQAFLFRDVRASSFDLGAFPASQLFRSRLPTGISMVSCITYSQRASWASRASCQTCAGPRPADVRPTWLATGAAPAPLCLLPPSLRLCLCFLSLSAGAACMHTHTDTHTYEYMP